MKNPHNPLKPLLLGLALATPLMLAACSPKQDEGTAPTPVETTPPAETPPPADDGTTPPADPNAPTPPPTTPPPETTAPDTPPPSGEQPPSSN